MQGFSLRFIRRSYVPRCELYLLGVNVNSSNLPHRSLYVLGTVNRQASRWNSGPSAGQKLNQRSVTDSHDVGRLNETTRPKLGPDGTNERKSVVQNAVATGKLILNQVMVGSKKLFDDTYHSLQLFYNSMQGYPIVKVKDIRHMERNKSDLLKLIPATVFAITPFTIYFFPLLIRYVPGFFPSPYWTQGMLEKRDQILAESRKEITPLIKQDIVRIRDALSSTSEKSGSFHVRLINQTLSRPPSSLTYSSFVPLLPVFRSHLTIGQLSTQKSKLYARYLGLSLPILFPRTRMIRKISSVLRQDHLLRTEGLRDFNETELRDLLFDRWFDRYEIEEIERKNGKDGLMDLLHSHTRWTKDVSEVDEYLAVVVARVYKLSRY